MEFDGTFTLADVSTEEVWLALSDSVTIERALPGCQFLVAVDEGEGSANDSSVETNSGMHLAETDGGVDVEWWTVADVFGRVAQMGQRVVNPVTNRVVNRFLERIQSQSTEVSTESSPGLRDRILDLP